MAEDGGQGDGEAGQQGRGQGVVGGEQGALGVGAVVQFQLNDGVGAQVEQPVFGDAGGGVELALLHQVAGAVGGQDFYYDVGDADYHSAGDDGGAAAPDDDKVGGQQQPGAFREQRQDDVVVDFRRRFGKVGEIEFEVDAQPTLHELVFRPGSGHNVQLSVVQFHFALVVGVGQVHELGYGQPHTGAGFGLGGGHRRWSPGKSQSYYKAVSPIMACERGVSDRIVYRIICWRSCRRAETALTQSTAQRFG